MRTADMLCKEVSELNVYSDGVEGPLASFDNCAPSLLGAISDDKAFNDAC
jgi:hypothetical protein